jgi:hypothetical protein
MPSTSSAARTRGSQSTGPPVRVQPRTSRARLDQCPDDTLLINISGMLTDARLVASIPRRVYLDLDPAFNQCWLAVEGVDMRFAGHTHFFTVGLAIGSDACDVPTCGCNWCPMLQPVVLPAWPMADTAGEAWTTVGNWRGYRSIERDGVLYGQKAHSVRRLIDLPSRTRATQRVLPRVRQAGRRRGHRLRQIPARRRAPVVVHVVGGSRGRHRRSRGRLAAAPSRGARNRGRAVPIGSRARRHAGADRRDEGGRCRRRAGAAEAGACAAVYGGNCETLTSPVLTVSVTARRFPGRP